MEIISYLHTVLLFWSCALASKTYIYLPINLGRYLHNTCPPGWYNPYLSVEKKQEMHKHLTQIADEYAKME